ncbi:MAG: glycosyltransferase family 4 protein [Verrucomicrobiales bacterium]|nr:glycosyltransferase family 4 protein [Verrucomicrobiales bacterium]
MRLSVAILTAEKREHDKDYANPTPTFGTAPEALLQGFALLPEVDVHVLSCVREPVRAPEKLADNIWYHSLHVPKNGWLRTGYQGCIRATRKMLHEIRPDIVHGQGTEHNNALCAVFSGFPNVLTIHGNMAALAALFRARFGGYYWLTARLEDFALGRTDGVFCNSAYTESQVRSRARKTWRVPNPLRREFFAPVPDGARPAVLLNVGVITGRKRQLELLDVAQNLHRLGLKFEFQFIGHVNPSEPYGAAFLERIKPLEAAGCARHLGEFATAELIRRFDAAGGLIHFPSEEAFGLVAAEGMARGLKFFGARVGGVTDIAGDVSGAELFDPEDWSGLTGAIAGWIRQGHPSLPEAAVQMREKYHPLSIARRHLEIYREVLGKKEG